MDLSSQTPTQKELEEGFFAVFLVAKENDKFAATTRAKDCENRDKGVKLGFPGGKMDQGENWEQTVRRESEEEGWLVDNDAVIVPYHKDVVQGHSILWCYVDNSKVHLLTEFKEQNRIRPLYVTGDELVGFGNENAIKHFHQLVKNDY